MCGEASDGREAVEMAKQLKPDVIIVDIGMPNLNGLDTTRQLMQYDPHFKIIVLTITDSDQVIREALDAGARGFVLKSDAARDLVSAVEALQSKRMFFTPRVNDLVLAGFLDKGHVDVAERSSEPADPHVKRARSHSVAGGRQEFEGSGVAAQSEHKNRGDSPQQHHAETQPAFDSRSGGLRDQEQHYSNPDAPTAERHGRKQRGVANAASHEWVKLNLKARREQAPNASRAQAPADIAEFGGSSRLERSWSDSPYGSICILHGTDGSGRNP